MKNYLIGVVCLFAFACNEAKGVGNLNTSISIECYSGGILIYQGATANDISSDFITDAYVFIEESTGKLKKVSGNCIITYN